MLNMIQSFQHTLLELKYNVHPLDGTSNKIRRTCTLKVYDTDNGMQSCTFGSDCAGANVTYRLTKMQFKQGTEDSNGFKHFLCCENIKPGTVIQYVGNRLNVLFYLAGNFF